MAMEWGVLYGFISSLGIIGQTRQAQYSLIKSIVVLLGIRYNTLVLSEISANLMQIMNKTT